MSAPDRPSPGARFERLLDLMARLRAPDGCPWDREQTFASIRPYTLEETYEVLDAIDRQDYPALAEELGDFVLQAVFYAQIAREMGLFDINDALDHINAKLVRRHPHVFGDGDAKTAAEVKQRWDEIKKTEKTGPPRGLLDGVPRAQPALAEAAQISSKAAGAGFDWPNLDGVLDKVREELGELQNAATPEEREAEFGDLLFTLVNVARVLHIDPEQSLRQTNRKFRERFGYVEAQLAQRGRTVQQSAAAEGIRELEELWQEAKCQNPS
jgi:MazG family protein